MRKGVLSLRWAPQVPFAIPLDFSDIWPGTYNIELRAACGEERGARRLEFRIEETMASMERDLDQSLDLIRLIATPEEVKEIGDAAPADRKQAWDRFWKRHDPTVDTPENEFKEEFFSRVRYANEHYSVLEPGWRSDRGKTYIQYGPPDRVENYPAELDTAAYEVWTYVRLGRRFVFVDYEGFGRYEFERPGR